MKSKNETAKTIESRVESGGVVRWRGLIWGQGKLKGITGKSIDRLKRSLKENGWIQPFFVWRRPDGEMVCLDGHHRRRAMMELEAEGVKIPEELPAVFVSAKDEAEARRLILLYSSQYARVDKAGLKEFLLTVGATPDEMFGVIDLPGIDEEIGKELVEEATERTAIRYENAIQLKPGREYVVVMCRDAEEWERLRGALDLAEVRRAGYRRGSPFDAVGTERVVEASRVLSKIGGKS